MNASIVQDSQDGAILAVHIQPSASRTELVGPHGAALKIRVTAPPVGGAANNELIRFLAVKLSVPVTAVRIQSNAGGRQKRLRIAGLTAKCVIERLNLEPDKSTVAR